MQVHVGWVEGGTAVFAFRGTASRQDGLQDVKIFSRNIDYLQELYPGVKAHLGQPTPLPPPPQFTLSPLPATCANQWLSLKCIMLRLKLWVNIAIAFMLQF